MNSFRYEVWMYERKDTTQLIHRVTLTPSVYGFIDRPLDSPCGSRFGLDVTLAKALRYLRDAAAGT